MTHYWATTLKNQNYRRLQYSVVGMLLFGVTCTIQAQWQTQSIELKGGWNAVFLHVDASHETLDALVGSDNSNPITQVWLWNPPPNTQIVDSPALPDNQISEWTSWVRGQPSSGLQRLVGDSAYLIVLPRNAPDYTWNIKGQPITPRPSWNVSGLNLVGFPTLPENPPDFEAFTGAAPELDLQTLEIFQYIGGRIRNNPVQILSSSRSTAFVNRGQAYWIRSGEVFNRYFGPFEIELSSVGGIKFGDQLSTYSFRLRNLTASSLTVSLQLADSESVPAGQIPLIGTPPMLVRGSLNLTHLTYGYTDLPVGSSQAWTLNARDQVGSEVEVVLGLDRSAMGGDAGDLLAGVLQFSDSLGHTRVDVPVSASVASSYGLWLGGAAITQVGQYLKTYARSGNDLIMDSNGQYLVTHIDTNLTAVPTSYPLRLIVHNPASGSATLLQRAYYGLDASTNAVIATTESALNPRFLNDSRRMSAAHLPWSDANPGWSFSGALGLGSTISASVTTVFNDQASNPFLHTYHPDHDNLDPQFQQSLAPGQESYTIIRDITLSVTPPGDDFASRTSGGLTLSGNYAETIRMEGLNRGGGDSDTRMFEVRGIFSLNQISDVPTLTSTP